MQWCNCSPPPLFFSDATWLSAVPGGELTDSASFSKRFHRSSGSFTTVPDSLLRCALKNQSKRLSVPISVHFSVHFSQYPIEAANNREAHHAWPLVTWWPPKGPSRGSVWVLWWFPLRESPGMSLTHNLQKQCCALGAWDELRAQGQPWCAIQDHPSASKDMMYSWGKSCAVDSNNTRFSYCAAVMDAVALCHLRVELDLVGLTLLGMLAAPPAVSNTWSLY